ncbi:MAG: hypothetical protein ACD_15C00045G0029 [uncultured bacterium]|nr:MAG: hypothetical protein ACD_15C00045G0029 [uncultured bacterium]HCU70206.1 hypothetical protein [Candidatus Moranbacteria bacterium]
MIINGIRLTAKQKLAVADKIWNLSREPNSSLLTETPEEIISIINDGITWVEMSNGTPRFIVAFMSTPHSKFVEIRMVCNLEPEKILRVKGKRAFLEIIHRYQEENVSKGEKCLFLTTTNIRMIRVARHANFQEMTDIRNFLPPNVFNYCCSYCPPEKTGVKEIGQQLKKCPRFNGEFISNEGRVTNHRQCSAFYKII